MSHIQAKGYILTLCCYLSWPKEKPVDASHSVLCPASAQGVTPGLSKVSSQRALWPLWLHSAPFSISR